MRGGGRRLEFHKSQRGGDRRLRQLWSGICLGYHKSEKEGGCRLGYHKSEREGGYRLGYHKSKKVGGCRLEHGSFKQDRRDLNYK